MVRKKYESYVKGYKTLNGLNIPIKAYIINVDNIPIGYIQIYNAHDFPRSKPLLGLPENLGAFDIFIGEEKYLGQKMSSKIISKFLSLYGSDYSHIFADPNLGNIVAIKSYEKAELRKFSEHQDTNEIWMIKRINTSKD
ncbi:MAG: GNAT family N-acetyltransferase [Candidatus Rickettsia vulgarisii]